MIDPEIGAVSHFWVEGDTRKRTVWSATGKIRPHMSLEPGTILGQYEIVSSLGSGGRGEVYRAKGTKLDRRQLWVTREPSADGRSQRRS